MEVQTSYTDNDVQGVWAEYQDGVKLLIARAGNPRFLKASDRAEAPHRRDIARNRLASDTALDIQCKAMGEGILLGWTGIDAGGAELPYTPENAAKVLRHNTRVREFVFEFALEESNYRQDAIDDTAKKSAAT